MQPATILLALIGPMAANAWSIFLYSGENCNGDAPFNDFEYSGNTQSGCLVAGMPGNDAVDHCIWHTNSASTSAPCTAPMIPEPKSWMFGSNGEPDPMCWVGYTNDCPGGWPKDQSPVVGQCYKVADKVIPGSGPLSFSCNDKHQD